VGRLREPADVEGPVSVTRTMPAARGPLRGSVAMPGDKSIAHRAVIFNAMAEGTATVSGLPDGADVASSMAAMRALGASISATGPGVRRIDGCRLALQQPPSPVDCGNSGTTMRLLLGLLAGQELTVTLTGDPSLSRRPMRRIADPLTAIGARVTTTDGHAPVVISGSRSLIARAHCLSVASAQLKTALLLAGLQARGRTEVSEPVLSRDHSERMLAAMGVPVERDAATSVAVVGPAIPRAVDLDVPGDVSSAAFLVVAATLVPDSDVVVEGVCVNPTRTGFIEILKRMGADVEVRARREEAGEPVGDLHVRAARLRGTDIAGDEGPSSIDELPILAVAAAAADGRTVISGAAELRVKESDRIAAIATLLAALGVSVEERDDGLAIEGGRLRGPALIDAGHDHRIVMAAAVAALAAAGPVTIDGAEAASVSFPGFFDCLTELGG
jgi:3-phosphoshikimate 1-carboxyvinyltransferase